MMPFPLTVALGLCTAFVAARSRRASEAATGQDLELLRAPPARFLRFPSLLGPRRADEILRSTALRAPLLEPSTVTGNVYNHRRSSVLWRGEDVAPDVAERLRSMAPELASHLGVPPFPIGELETQVTVSQDGDYFRRHDDNGSPSPGSTTSTAIHDRSSAVSW